MDDSNLSGLSGRHIYQLLMLSATTVQLTAMIYRENAQFQQLLTNYSTHGATEDLADEAEIAEDEETEATLIFSAGLQLLMQCSLLLCSHLRGPYDQIAKCSQWFLIALSWPDPEFRHEFR